MKVERRRDANNIQRRILKRFRISGRSEPGTKKHKVECKEDYTKTIGRVFQGSNLSNKENQFAQKYKFTK